MKQFSADFTSAAHRLIVGDTLRTNGTTSVDFAGTMDEARAYIKEHTGKFPHGLTLGRGGGERSPNGDPMLFSRYRNTGEKKKVTSAFNELGWDHLD